MRNPTEGESSTDHTTSSEAGRDSSRYEAPAIVERTSIHDALIGVVGSGGGGGGGGGGGCCF